MEIMSSCTLRISPDESIRLDSEIGKMCRNGQILPFGNLLVPGGSLNARLWFPLSRTSQHLRPEQTRGLHGIAQALNADQDLEGLITHRTAASSRSFWTTPQVLTYLQGGRVITRQREWLPPCRGCYFEAPYPTS
jgi:hypothetical protein